jgi:hypothetical protein
MSTKKLARAKIVRELAADGVDTVPKLVDRLLDLQESQLRKPHPGAVPTATVLAKMGVPSPGLKKIVHRPPKIPLYVDGVLLDPADISRFNGQPLHFVVGAKNPVEGKPVLQAFTGSDYLNFLKATYIASLVTQDLCPGEKPCYVVPPPHPNPNLPGTHNVVQACDEIEYFGEVLDVYPGFSLPDLRNLYRLFPFRGNWNDCINSVRPCYNNIVTFFSDINFGGNQLTLPRGYAAPDLAWWGWNNTISSVTNWG